MAWTTATFDEVLDDLSSRFIINVPDEELASVERICFQIEQAHWFYEDFVREQNPALPSFNLKNFCAKFFQHCPLLHEWSNEHETAFANFMEYKIRVPVCGAIILNEAMDKCILVKGWTARSGWGFPKGKINKDEPDTLCAVREVWEETGYDVADRIRDEDFVEQTIKDQRIRLYIIKGVPEDTVFEPQTRKEISKIEWHYIAELPTSRPKPSDKGTHSGKESGTERASGPKGSSRYYMVTPFVHKLKSWIVAQRRNNKRNRGQNAQSHNHGENHAANAASRHSNGHQHQAAAPTISSAEARLDSEVLKNMLGIGKGASSSQDSVPSAQRQTSSNHEMSPPLSDTMNSSESLKALLGIQSPSSGNNNNLFAREGMTTGSPTIQPASTTSSYSIRPVSTPASSSSASYQNGSEALKAMLGIPSQPNSPAPRFNHIANGASPVMSNAGVIPNGQGQYRPDFSPQIHHSSATNSPMNARNGSVDLLALLKGGNGNGNGNGHGDGAFYNNNNASKTNSHRNSGLGNGTPAKPKNMTNFTFDVEALY
ncbi:mRNA-decapping enzyme subunit 2 [Entomortierella chlamydospora]|uniref:mRNA-decapping enzyme subunit 2 n=1 Tax=Entomortierella chlamydospora TaxID=101097 RepID=A0A9P6T133_9FUNG|nr:mRNA-decapping enzyme subunit 2 [Entomortierella chlamydospora]KAG0017099.1 mRNA-decapping enzyme subunit 2 [Entomortierella chlamydospora]